MKKAIRIFLAFIATALGLSCTRVPAPAEVVTITINLAGTKSIQSDIDALMPSEIAISLHNQSTGEDYYGVTGQPITIPTGTYAVTADYSPGNSVIFGWTGGNLSTAPAFNVNVAVVVASDAANYYLPVTYNSFCVIADKTQVKKLDAACSGFESTIWNNPASAPDYLFVNRGAEDITFTLTMNDNSVSEHHFTTDAEVAGAHPDYTLAVKGKYYAIGGAAVAPVSPSYNFGLDIPSWEPGD